MAGTRKKNLIDHRDRKNPASAEYYARERKKRNAARGKQRWDAVEKVWKRDSI